MSRADIEESLKGERRAERSSSRWAGALATYVTAELTLIGAALTDEVSKHHPIGINGTAGTVMFLTGLPAVYGIVRNSLSSRSHANTAAVLEGVLAQEQLSAPELLAVE